MSSSANRAANNASNAGAAAVVAAASSAAPAPLANAAANAGAAASGAAEAVQQTVNSGAPASVVNAAAAAANASAKAAEAATKAVKVAAGVTNGSAVPNGPAPLPPATPIPAPVNTTALTITAPVAGQTRRDLRGRMCDRITTDIIPRLRAFMQKHPICKDRQDFVRRVLKYIKKTLQTRIELIEAAAVKKLGINKSLVNQGKRALLDATSEKRKEIVNKVLKFFSEHDTAINALLTSVTIPIGFVCDHIGGQDYVNPIIDGILEVVGYIIQKTCSAQKLVWSDMFPSGIVGKVKNSYKTFKTGVKSLGSKAKQFFKNTRNRIFKRNGTAPKKTMSQAIRNLVSSTKDDFGTIKRSLTPLVQLLKKVNPTYAEKLEQHAESASSTVQRAFNEHANQFDKAGNILEKGAASLRALSEVSPSAAKISGTLDGILNGRIGAKNAAAEIVKAASNYSAGNQGNKQALETVIRTLVEHLKEAQKSSPNVPIPANATVGGRYTRRNRRFRR
jgi:hypothetical protein